MKEKIKAFVNSRRDEIAKTLIDLIKIPSVSTDTAACQKMHEATKALYEQNGFETQSFEEYLLAYYGEGERLGLFAHGDVVDGGKNWLYTENPFEPKVMGDFIIGRGAWDDKAAIVCSLYTLIALKKLGVPVHKKIECFTGFNEENGMTDVKSYVKSHTPPDFSLVLDAGFPAYYGDKGKSWVKVRAKKPFSQITSLSGGKAINIILDKAEARVKYTPELMESLAETDRVKISRQGDEIVLCSEGISAHGANPQGTINGVWLIACALKDAQSLPPQDREILLALEKILSDPYGGCVGIDNKDDEFGDLTMTNGMICLENGKACFTLDLRYGSHVKMAEMLKTLEKELDSLGFEIEIIDADDAYILDKENAYLKKYMEAYVEYTGENERKMHTNVGSTYAKVIGNACGVGTRYKGQRLELPAGHGHAHQPDEYMSIEGLLNALEIIIYTVSRLAQE